METKFLGLPPKDTNGNIFDSSIVLDKKPAVIYFYPKDDTPGCTTQACSFRDQYEDFTDLGAEVIGVSSDSIASHQSLFRSTSFLLVIIG